MSFTHSPHTHFNHLVWLTYYQDNRRIKSKERNKSWLPWREKKFFFLSKWDWGHTRETWKENEVLETSKNIPKMEKKIYPAIGKERCTSYMTERATGAPINLTEEERWGLRWSSGKARLWPPTGDRIKGADRPQCNLLGDLPLKIGKGMQNC